MSAIITEKFRRHNAKNFHESFSESSPDTYYLFLGKATPFTTGTSGGSDTSPSTPADSVSREFYNWDSMLAAKKIPSTDIAFALTRRNWSNNTVFDMYKDTSVHLILQQVVHLIYLTHHFTLLPLTLECIKFLTITVELHIVEQNLHLNQHLHLS